MSSIRKDGRGKRAAARQAEVSETPLVKRLALERKDPYACFKEASVHFSMFILLVKCLLCLLASLIFRPFPLLHSSV
jgi:hypothetical protein